MTIQTADPGSLLIVDDEEMNRDMLSQRLELKGYKVTAADDGRRALVADRATRPSTSSCWTS